MAFVSEVVSKQKGKQYSTFLVREGYRENGKVKMRTLANLSAPPRHAIQAVELALKTGSRSTVSEGSEAG